MAAHAARIGTAAPPAARDLAFLAAVRGKAGFGNADQTIGAAGLAVAAELVLPATPAVAPLGVLRAAVRVVGGIVADARFAGLTAEPVGARAARNPPLLAADRRVAVNTGVADFVAQATRIAAHLAGVAAPWGRRVVAGQARLVAPATPALKQVRARLLGVFAAGGLGAGIARMARLVVLAAQRVKGIPATVGVPRAAPVEARRLGVDAANRRVAGRIRWMTRLKRAAARLLAAPPGAARGLLRAAEAAAPLLLGTAKRGAARGPDTGATRTAKRAAAALPVGAFAALARLCLAATEGALVEKRLALVLLLFLPLRLGSVRDTFDRTAQQCRDASACRGSLPLPGGSAWIPNALTP